MLRVAVKFLGGGFSEQFKISPGILVCHQNLEERTRSFPVYQEPAICLNSAGYKFSKPPSMLSSEE